MADWLRVGGASPRAWHCDWAWDGEQCWYGRGGAECGAADGAGWLGDWIRGTADGGQWELGDVAGRAVLCWCDNTAGLEVFNSELQFGDINPDEIYLVPPPPPVAWGEGVLVDDRPYVRSAGAMFNGSVNTHEYLSWPVSLEYVSASVWDASCTQLDTPCVNGGVCSDWLWLDERRVFSDGYGCVCPFEYGGRYCEVALYEEVVGSTEWAPGCTM